MSGHSHFATIKRQKELKDKSKGKIFSKLGRSISMAVKEGGGPDPDSNYKLRIAINSARSSNMPKDNIARAIANAAKEGNLEEVMYEGFGPGGVGFLVTAATDNRNRTSQEMKNIFEKNGGSLGSPGSAAFNFEPEVVNGVIIQKPKYPILITDPAILEKINKLIENLNENDDVQEVFTNFKVE